ncbi:MAG: hypothetical protein GHCLOJNM_01812 [bacterium]|nr:hypothetical protein [bacterium]
MALDIVPEHLRERYCLAEHRHAIGVLSSDFPEQWSDLLACLEAFRLRRSAIIVKGGGRSNVPKEIDGFLQRRGWGKRSFQIDLRVDGRDYPTRTHEVDNEKGGIGLEVEWNNKTEFYDRDLNNFRLLHSIGALSVGIIITRTSELQDLLNSLGIGSKYGPSTTHWDKLMPKVNSGAAGGCPLLLIGITRLCYSEKE